jgi:hypothetical protein
MKRRFLALLLLSALVCGQALGSSSSGNISAWNR